jgi:hypothetical protein
MLFSNKKLRGKSIGTILMVGGFSQSPVLYDRIKSAFPNMEVICTQSCPNLLTPSSIVYLGLGTLVSYTSTEASVS